MSDTPAGRASVIRFCQDKAASFGYDTVSLRNYTRRRTEGGIILSSSCYACKGCAFYVGGSVPASTTCSPAVTNCDPLYDGQNCNVATTSCGVAGCRSCTTGTGTDSRALVNQVYRLRPAGSVLAPSPPLPPSPPPAVPPPALPLKCPSFYTLSNGAIAPSTTCVIYNLRAGAVLALGTSRIAGSVCYGDTYLRLLNSAGVQVAYNDDSVGSCSWLQYTVPTAGTYTILNGCYVGTSCAGTVAYTIN